MSRFGCYCYDCNTGQGRATSRDPIALPVQQYSHVTQSSPGSDCHSMRSECDTQDLFMRLLDGLLRAYWRHYRIPSRTPLGSIQDTIECPSHPSELVQAQPRLLAPQYVYSIVLASESSFSLPSLVSSYSAIHRALEHPPYRLCAVPSQLIMVFCFD